MIIQIEQDIQEKAKENIINRINELGYECTDVKTQNNNYLVAIGKKEFDIRAIGGMEGIRDVHRVSDNYKLVSRKWKVYPSRIDLGDDVAIGSTNFTVMAGPCSIENEEQVIHIIEHLKENDVRIMRGGVFKPRTSPYAFRGLGLEGLKMFYRLARESGIKIITEVMELAQIEPMHDYIDIFQVGARNTQNFNLLHELGKTDKPVMIKRGISGSIDELLQSAEYIFSSGNERLMLCERGIRTFENAYRNTLDLNAIPILKEKTHLPVIVDPSHGIGIRDYVEPMALAGVMSGADGIIIEVHKTPDKALSDGQQTLDFDESSDLIRKIKKVVGVRNSL